MNSLYVDVAAVIAGGVTAPEPDILRFVDDSYLFYTGEFNLVFGDAECGKTWLCLAAVAHTLQGGAGKAVVVDLDHNGADSIVNRLLLLGADVDVLSNQQCFRLATPNDEIELKELIADITLFKPDVVILDSLGEILPLFGANSNSGDDFTSVHTKVIKPLTSAGIAVLVVDHLPKGDAARQHGPTGTTAKVRAVGGTAVRVTAEKAFRPGVGGAAKLELHKDRHGGMRKILPDSDGKPVMGTFTLTEEAGKLSYSFQSALTVRKDRQAELDEARAEDDATRLRELAADGIDVATIRDVRSALGVGQNRAQAALGRLRNRSTATSTALAESVT